jgi:hypothetical protein
MSAMGNRPERRGSAEIETSAAHFSFRAENQERSLDGALVSTNESQTGVSTSPGQALVLVYMVHPCRA